MKNAGLLLAFWLVSVGPLCAQVKVELKLEQEQFLPGEALPVQVQVINRSGQTLHLGKDPDWLVFAVEAKDNSVVVKKKDVPVVGEFTLPSSKRALKTVDLAPCFSLLKPGRYSIIATVFIKEWNQQVASPEQSFDIVKAVDSGASKWECLWLPAKQIGILSFGSIRWSRRIT